MKDTLRVKKIDRYVVVTFLGPFILCVVGFAGLYVVIDFFSNVDQFLAHESIFKMVRLTARYYTLRLPSHLAQIMPMISVIPAVICILRLQRTNELSAMRSVGLSGRRISVPLICCGVGVMILGALNQELLVPALHGSLRAAERIARKGETGEVEDAQVVDKTERLFLVSSFNPQAPLPTLTDISIEWHDEEGARHEKRAARAFALELGPTWYMEGLEHFRGRRTGVLRKWIWEKQPPDSFTSPATHRRLEEYKNAVHPDKISLMPYDEQPVPTQYRFGAYTETEEFWPVASDVEIICPGTDEGRVHIGRMVWIKDGWLIFGAWQFGKMDPETHELERKQLADGHVLKASIRPDDIQAGEFRRASAMMSLVELADRGSKYTNRRVRKRCWVRIWNRVALPIANIALMVLAMVLVVRQATHAVVLGLSIAIVMTLLYMAANVISIDLADRQFLLWRWPPFAGAFPTVLFACVAAWLFTKMDKV